MWENYYVHKSNQQYLVFCFNFKLVLKLPISETLLPQAIQPEAVFIAAVEQSASLELSFIFVVPSLNTNFLTFQLPPWPRTHLMAAL